MKKIPMPNKREPLDVNGIMNWIIWGKKEGSIYDAGFRKETNPKINFDVRAEEDAIADSLRNN